MTTIDDSPEYLELTFSTVPSEWKDILTAELTGIGVDGFFEEQEILKAYIPASCFSESRLHEILGRYPSLKGVGWSIAPLPVQNWNALWESNYEPVTVAGCCHIRAPFHPPAPDDIRYELVIEPKMSFGTAHHDTTALMIGFLLDENCQGKDVLDMGCGTGILAILAAMRGAGRVVAIDNDEWAVENTRENILRNLSGEITVILGSDSEIPDQQFDLILANINRNVLLEQIDSYSKALSAQGSLIISGFLSDDLTVLLDAALTRGFSHVETRQSQSWMCVKFNR